MRVNPFCYFGEFFAVTALAVVSLAPPAQSEAATTAGNFWSEPPTLVSLGFEWRISGDDNRNAKVEVTYRKAGEQHGRGGPSPHASRSRDRDRSRSGSGGAWKRGSRSRSRTGVGNLRFAEYVRGQHLE